MTAPDLGALAFCYVTTTGRRTGRPHTIEIWFALDGRSLYLLAGGGRTSDWVRNIEADDRVGVLLGDESLAGRGRVVADAAEERRARDLVYAKYAPTQGDLEAWRERALPIAIDLVDVPAA